MNMKIAKIVSVQWRRYQWMSHRKRLTNPQKRNLWKEKEVSKDQYFTSMPSAPEGEQDTLDENSTTVKESKNDGPSLNTSTQMQCDCNDTPIMLEKMLIGIIDSIDELLNNTPTEREGKVLDKIQQFKCTENSKTRTNAAKQI
jgi:hypothetical protein